MANANETAPSVSTGEAARRLGVSRQTVRRLIEADALEAAWTRQRTAWTRDSEGRVMRGHRRVTVASIDAYLAEARNKS